MLKPLAQCAALIVTAVLAACQPANQAALPTLVGAAQTTLDETSSATPGPTATSTRRAASLPPTFTPTPSETPTLRPTDERTATPPGFRPQGTIFYVYNGDAIIALDPQSGEEQVVMQFGMGQRLADLSASPDAALLAFTAPSINASREAHVMNRDGSYVQQISCLRFGELRLPRWTADGAALAFFAAQAPQGRGNLFRADIAGAGNCPQDNRQGLLFNAVLERFGDLAYYDARQVWLVASDEGIVAYGADSGLAPYVPPNAYGPQVRLRFSASREFLSYIAIIPAIGGYTTEARLLSLEEGLPSQAREGSTLFADALDTAWHPRQDRLLIVGRTAFALADVRGSLRLLEVGRLRDAVGTFSADGQSIAYSALDENDVLQVYSLALDDPAAAPRQLTRHAEGSIDELLWLP